jgi:hypothetical protein
MSDQPQQPPPQQPPPQPQQPPPHQEPPENGDKEEEAVQNGQDTLLYSKICEALDTERATDESIEEFKIRVVTEFSDMTAWPDAKYETLPSDVQDWVYAATTAHKGNTNKKRKKVLPDLPGLDPMPIPKQAKKIKRASLVDEPKHGRARGDDCLTRTMKILIDNPDPDKIKAQDLAGMLEARYGRKYSPAAVRYAQQAFTTARNLLAARTAA